MKLKFILLFLVILMIGFVSSATYGSGTFGTGNFGSGEEAPVVEEVVTPSGGGGGGCSYNWTCTNWFPDECPADGIQERLCVNYGTCTGTSGMPEQTRECTYVHGEPLFDIFLTIS